jgi:hypothetical protein
MMAGKKTTVIIEPDGEGEREGPRRGRPPKPREQTNTILTMQDLSELQDVTNEAINNEGNPRISLYREDRSGTQTVYLFLDDLDHCPVSYTEIGEKYGGGRFRIYSRWKIPETGVWHVVMHNFALSPRFDSIARSNATREVDDTGLPIGAPARAAVPQAQAVVVRQAEPPRDRMQDTLMVIREIAAVMAPLLKPQRDPMEMLSMIVGMGQTMFKRSLDQADEYGRRIMDMADAQAGIEQEPEAAPAAEEVAPKDPVIAMMLEALKTIVPMFRSIPDATAKAAAQPIASRPDVKALLSDVKRRRRMMYELRQAYPEREVERLCRVFAVPYKAPDPVVRHPRQEYGEEAAEDRMTAAAPVDQDADAGQVQPFVQTDLFRQADAAQGPESAAGAEVAEIE